MSKKISELTPLTTLSGNEEIPVALAGVNSKIKLSDLRKSVTAADVTDLSAAVATINANLNLNVSLQNSEW
jgi:hypothetical protein